MLQQNYYITWISTTGERTVRFSSISDYEEACRLAGLLLDYDPRCQPEIGLRFPGDSRIGNLLKGELRLTRLNQLLRWTGFWLMPTPEGGWWVHSARGPLCRLVLQENDQCWHFLPQSLVADYEPFLSELRELEVSRAA